MEIKTFTGTASAYPDTSAPVQRTNTVSDYPAEGSYNPVGLETGTAGAPSRTSNEQEDKASAGSQQKKDELNSQRLKSAVNQANSKMKITRTGCEFVYHEETNRVSIKVYDKDTKEVLREIPPEESLEMLEKMWEIAGLLFDEKR